MSFPDHEQESAQDVSMALNTAGFAQDVVVATSRLIHDQELTEDDRRALAECQGLLRRMISTDVVFARSGERQLAATNTVALLRKASAGRENPGESLANAIEALERLLAGERTVERVDEVRKLRDIFLTVGEVNLVVMTRQSAGREDSGDWTTLIANSLS